MSLFHVLLVLKIIFTEWAYDSVIELLISCNRGTMTIEVQSDNVMQKYLNSGLFSSGNARVINFNIHIFTLLLFIMLKTLNKTLFSSHYCDQHLAISFSIFQCWYSHSLIFYVLNSERPLFWIEYFLSIYVCLLQIIIYAILLSVLNS